MLFADLHMKPVNLPEGDVLVFAGDMCLPGELWEVHGFADWLGIQRHRHKIVIAGNHDFPFERPEERGEARRLIEAVGATYLEDSGAQIDGVRFWGSPWQPWFYNWAFNLQRGAEIRAKWELIPDRTDVLITHGPPEGFGDFNGRRHVGCADLLNAVAIVAPKLHVFGHIHEGYGITHRNGTTLINASVCNSRYEPVNAPVVFELKDA